MTNRIASALALVVVTLSSFAINGCATHGQVVSLQRQLLDQRDVVRQQEERINALVSLTSALEERNTKLEERVCNNTPGCVVIELPAPTEYEDRNGVAHFDLPAPATK